MRCWSRRDRCWSWSAAASTPRSGQRPTGQGGEPGAGGRREGGRRGRTPSATAWSADAGGGGEILGPEPPADAMLNGHYPLGFKLALHYKDLGIEAASDAGVDLPVTALVQRMEAALMAAGHGDEDGCPHCRNSLTTQSTISTRSEIFDLNRASGEHATTRTRLVAATSPSGCTASCPGLRPWPLGAWTDLNRPPPPRAPSAAGAAADRAPARGSTAAGHWPHRMAEGSSTITSTSYRLPVSTDPNRHGDRQRRATLSNSDCSLSNSCSTRRPPSTRTNSTDWPQGDSADHRPGLTAHIHLQPRRPCASPPLHGPKGLGNSA